MSRIGREHGFKDSEGGGAGGAGGGAGRILHRLFENPENPLGWSIKLFTAGGITVRIHLITVIYMVSMLLWSIPQGHAGLLWTGLGMGTLFIVVLLHEFGHCIACRGVGGEADRIVMLPWGGLALCRPPHDWRANFITTFGGPGVNILLMPLTIAALALAGLARHIIFNPFAPGLTLTDPDFSTGSAFTSALRIGLWMFHYTNFIIFAFNMLLFMFPFDCGRLVQALIWRSAGFRRATEIAVLIGFAGAILLGIFGLVADHSMLVAIAVFGGLACWMERRRLTGEFELGDPSYAPGTGAYAAVPIEDDGYAALARKQAKEREKQAQEQREVDRILEKISREGMGSLSRRERRTLDEASRRPK